MGQEVKIMDGNKVQESCVALIHRFLELNLQPPTMLIAEIVTFWWDVWSLLNNFGGARTSSGTGTGLWNLVSGIGFGNRQLDNTGSLAKDVNLVSFYLYANPGKPEAKETLLLGNPSSVENSLYRKNFPVIFLIHGFTSNSSDTFAQTVKNAFLSTVSTVRANIITVDWGPLSSPTGPTPELYYSSVLANIEPVAGRISEFIQFLINIHALKGPGDVQVIGFSLGAHVAGITGQSVNTTYGQLLGRVTGLDPAGPGFQSRPATEKLDKTHALFVDVYHTNKGMKGYAYPIGHVDFYPNGGGPFQPGCSNVTEFSDVYTGTCSHRRAFEYFAASIKNSSISACKCNSDVPVVPGKKEGSFNRNRFVIPESCKVVPCEERVTFGQFCPSSTSGVYYLEITKNSN